jgi:hypothetical protein
VAIGTSFAAIAYHLFKKFRHKHEERGEGEEEVVEKKREDENERPEFGEEPMIMNQSMHKLESF